MVNGARGQAMLESMVVIACMAAGIGLALAAVGSGVVARADALAVFYRMPFP